MRPRMKTYPVGRVIESTYARRNGKERYYEGGGSPLGDLLSGIPWLKTHSLVTRFRNSFEPKIRAVPHDIVRIYRDAIRLRTIWYRSVSPSPLSLSHSLSLSLSPLASFTLASPILLARIRTRANLSRLSISSRVTLFEISMTRGSSREVMRSLQEVNRYHSYNIIGIK